MKSPFAQTALMGLLATVASIVAAIFYPWPETVVESDMIGKQLFEAYDASSVRSISIIKYEPERNGISRIELVRNGEKWLIPAQQNYIADNAAQISLVINSVNGTVLEQRSSGQQDHVEYGVVDPLEYESATNRSSLGTKIVFADRNNRELANLIVGLSPRGEPGQQQKYFVRIPGEPNVYVINIPAQVLTTDFTRWVSPNLLSLSQDSTPNSVSIHNYRKTKSQLSAADKLTWNYDLLIDARNKKRILKVPAPSSGELQEMAVTDENTAQLQQLGNFLGNIVFTNVRKKPAAVAAILSKPNAEKSAELDSLKDSGFVVLDQRSDTEFGLQFQSSAGEVSVHTSDGVAISLLVGEIVESPTPGDLSLNYLVMLYASVDQAAFSNPTPPADSADPATADKEQKTYLRLVEARTANLKSAVQRASELNQSYADWYYVVSEDIINGLRPDLNLQAPAASEPAAVEGGSVEAGNTEEPSKD